MDEISDLSKKRLSYLRALYEETQADEYKAVRTYEIAGNRAYEKTLTDKIVRYLEREGLVELGSTGSQICITHAGIREVEQGLAGMLDEMLVFMAQAGKDVFGADEVAEALQVRESEVTRLYRQASDQGWVRKFSDKPPMFRLTGSGAQQASRVLTNRAVSRAGACPGGGVGGAAATATERRPRVASPRRVGAAVCVVLAAAAAVAKLWEFCEGHWWCARAAGACSALVVRCWWLVAGAGALAAVVGVLVWLRRRAPSAGEEDD